MAQDWSLTHVPPMLLYCGKWNPVNGDLTVDTAQCLAIFPSPMLDITAAFPAFPGRQT